MSGNRYLRRGGLPLLLILGLLAGQHFYPDAGIDPCGLQNDRGRVEAAFNDRQSRVWLETCGVVTRLLEDDNEGRAHQRFILELDAGHTLLVSHNIDLAGRIPLARGDRLSLRGRYEWNGQGGVLHWTHHDPDGRQPGGWIEHHGMRYR